MLSTRLQFQPSLSILPNAPRKKCSEKTVTEFRSRSQIFIWLDNSYRKSCQFLFLQNVLELLEKNKEKDHLESIIFVVFIPINCYNRFVRIIGNMCESFHNWNTEKNKVKKNFGKKISHRTETPDYCRYRFII